MKKLQKGFTLIELLVVIAIIGILSSIVLASLSSARTKGEDAAIISTLSNMRVQGELLYSTNGNYGISFAHASCVTTNANDIFGTSTVGSLKNLTSDLIKKAGTGTNDTRCAASSTAWAAAAKLKSDSSKGTACVDSSGQSVSSTTAANASVAINPATGTCY